MERLCAQLPNGEIFLELWLAFEARACPESKVAKQIDKLQMAYKAAAYHVELGFDPREFLEDADRKIQHPMLRDILARLKEAVSLPE
jgi:5'-deoxynucleotidase YfbR-like HD superfamily hydrolase